MVPQGRQGDAVSEVWVSHDELAEAVGETGAVILCAARGGRSLFIPKKPCGYLLELLGSQRMGYLCAVFGGMQVVVPNLRRGEPFKDRILSRLEAGEKPDAIAQALGVTTRYVRRLKKQLRGIPEPQRQYRLL